MRILIDNTMLHAVGRVIDSRSPEPILVYDALALLSFAEHLLFADEICFSLFESAPVQERSLEIVESLRREECLPSTSGGVGPFGHLLVGRPFESTEYMAAAREGAARLAAAIPPGGWLDRETLAQLGTLATTDARPERFKVPSVTQLLAQPITDAPIDPLPTVAHHGSFHYLLATNAPLREALIDRVRGREPFTQNEEAALHGLARLEINRSLAGCIDAVYSPAPRRQRLTQEVERSFRRELDQILWKYVSERRGSSYHPDFFESLVEREKLPLPTLALGFLHHAQEIGPLQLLRLAVQLRDENDAVRKVRSWLQRWEAYEADHQAARKELNSLAGELPTQGTQMAPSAVLISSWEVVKSLLMRRLPDIPKELLVKVDALLSRRPRTYLAALSDSLAEERSFGAWLIHALGRPIVP